MPDTASVSSDAPALDEGASPAGSRGAEPASPGERAGLPGAGGTRSARRKARTEQAILAASEQLFLERGFHGVTVDQIAEAADVAIGSIYLHFDNKEGLYLALLERALEVEETHMAAAFDPRLLPVEQLFRAGHAYLRFYLENPGYFRMLVFPHLDGRPPARAHPAAQRLATKAEAQVTRLADVIEACVQDGIIRPFDAYRVAKFMWGAWNGVIALNLRADRLRLSDDELERVIQEGSRMIAEGLAAMPLRDADGGLPPALFDVPLGGPR